MAENNEIREKSVVIGRTIGVLVLLTGILLAAHLCVAESPGSNPIPSIFKPHSTPAESIYHLSLFVLGITSLIFLVVFSLLLYVVVKFRGRAADESWSLPFSVLLSTPVAIFGAFAVLWLRRFLVSVFYPPYLVQIENDVYSRIGLVMLIGLAAKNAILIVEFAKDQFEKGKPLVDAALEGARLRLRPIFMTSFAFILGCVPLWTASGAGAVARQIMGTTVIGGMLAASFIGIFFVPAIFHLVEKWSGAGTQAAAGSLPATAAPASVKGD